MDRELKFHINKLQFKAVLNLIVSVLLVCSFALGIYFLFVPSYAAIVSFFVAVLCVLYLLFVNRRKKKDSSEIKTVPFELIFEDSITYEKLIDVFKNLTDAENRICDLENIHFYRFERKFKTRAVLYNTDEFRKGDFDREKAKINKTANEKFNIPQNCSKSAAVKMMRINIICTDSVNDELNGYISHNALHNLRRVEGVINIAAVGNRIIMPPLYGDCDILEIKRYKGILRFIYDVLSV